MTDPAVLRTNDLVGGYLPGVDILTGCSTRVDRDEIVVVIGPNGAGKSTLAKAIFGLVEVRSGTIELNGQDITGSAPHEVSRRGIAYVPQLDNVFPSLSVRENLEMGAVTARAATLNRRIDAMYDLFPRLGERTRQRAGSLSGGERQMLAMARAMVPEPQVMLLDEPSAGLAPRAVAEVFETVQEVNRSGVTILMIEQNARQALGIADRGYVLEGGADRFEGAGEELLGNPQVAALYLGGPAENKDGRPEGRPS